LSFQVGTLLLHVQLDGVERVVALGEFEELVRAGGIGPETPVRQDALTAGRWIPAGELAFYRGLRDSPDVLVREAWAHPGIPWFTALMVGLEIRMFLWTNHSGLDAALGTALAKSTPPIVEQGQVWRLWTHALLHANFGHIAGNLIFLAYVGVALEGVIGSVNLALLFAGSVFWGGFVSAIFAPESQSIGASGGDFGYLAAAVVFGFRYRDLLPARARPRFGWVLIGYLGFYVLMSLLLPNEQVDNWAHLGGLLAGGLHMALLRPNVGGAWKAHNRRVSVGASLAMAVAAAAIVCTPIRLVAVEEDGLVSARPSWWDVGWSVAGDRGWASPVGSGTVVIRTTHGDAPASLAVATESLLESYRDFDGNLVSGPPEDLVHDGVAGRRLHLAYTNEGVARTVDAEVFTRGRYTHLVLVDLADAGPAVEGLPDRLFSGLSLPLPADVRTAEAARGGWRGLLRQAEGLADIGDATTARARVEAARQAAPREPAPMEAALAIEAAYPGPDAVARVEEALATFPEDRRMLEAAVRVLVAAGRRDDALARLDARIAAAPGDRRLTRLRDELTGVPGGE
jgi:rhomboid protease GluP